MGDDLLAEIQRDPGLHQKIWDALRRAQKAKRNKRRLDECLAVAYDAFAEDLERSGKLTLERVDSILTVLCSWLDRASWPVPILGAQPTRPIRYRFDLVEAQDSTAVKLRHAAASWTVEVLERLLADHLAYWRIRVQSREAKEKPKISVFTEPHTPIPAADRIRSDSDQKDPAEVLDPPTRVEASSAAALLDSNVTERDLYAQIRSKLPFKELATRLENEHKVTRSTLAGYAQHLNGETPARPLSAAMIDKIKAAIRALADELARAEKSSARARTPANDLSK
jgi:hypothetical protein